jgi:hypothetical protein
MKVTTLVLIGLSCMDMGIYLISPLPSAFMAWCLFNKRNYFYIRKVGHVVVSWIRLDQDKGLQQATVTMIHLDSRKVVIS